MVEVGFEKVFGSDVSDIAPHGAFDAEFTAGFEVDCFEVEIEAPITRYDGGFVLEAAPTWADLLGRQFGVQSRQRQNKHVRTFTTLNSPFLLTDSTYKANNDNGNKRIGIKVETKVKGEIIAAGKNVVITKFNGALIVHERRHPKNSCKECFREKREVKEKYGLLQGKNSAESR
ncbi:hypothetical protein DRP05_07980 [Archaeoglobales archaeon]|nr:MAG: hypothetical protein DRP05_07980 [Archaeoglobales archaeon]